MPTLAVDTITDSAGSGAPNFPNGIAQGTNNRFLQVFTDATSYTTTTNPIAPLTMNNLTVGYFYTVTLKAAIKDDQGNSGGVNAQIIHDSTVLATLGVNHVSSTGGDDSYLDGTISASFIATAASVTFAANVDIAASSVGSLQATIYEDPYTEATSKFTP